MEVDKYVTYWQKKISLPRLENFAFVTVFTCAVPLTKHTAHVLSEMKFLFKHKAQDFQESSWFQDTSY